MQQEAVSTPGKNKAEISSESTGERDISDPVQELPIVAEEDKQEPEAVETPEADQAKATETETVEEEKQVVSDEQEDVDGEEPANDLSEEGDSPVEADQEEKVKPEEEQTEESEVNETEAEEAETDAVDKTEKTAQKGEVLEKGAVLDPQVLKANAPAAETKGNVKEVSNFEDLKQALEDAEDGVETTIVITKSFEIKTTLTIGEGKKIILTSYDGKKMDDPWEKIKQPKDYADQGEEKQPKDYADKGEKKQRKVIKEGRDRGEKAIEDAEKNVTKKVTAVTITTLKKIKKISFSKERRILSPCLMLRGN